jgi:hypothetical protein
MIEENLETFMSKVDVINKEIAIYKNEEKGLTYPIGTPSLLCRVDYLELTKEELEKAKFEQQIEKKEYEMYDCVKVVPKYEITKIEADKFKLTDKKVKATHIYNVKNQIGIHTTLEDKEEAFKLCKEINNKIIEKF